MTDFKHLAQELADDLEAWVQYLETQSSIAVDICDLDDSNKLLKRAYKALWQAEKSE
jgi:hypothetical protein